MSVDQTPVRPQVEGSVAVNTAVEKRSIQMKQFRDNDALKRCVAEQQAIALGQIIGHAFEVVMKKGQLPDGSLSESPFIVGDFEAVKYKTGEVMSASGAYLPRYFAETIQAALKKGAGASHGIAFAIEIVVEPTGKSQTGVAPDGVTTVPIGIPYAYGVKRLIERRPDNPIEQMKRALLAQGTLRLPAPKQADPMALGTDLPEPEGGEVEGEGASQDEGPAEQANAPAATTEAPKTRKK